MNSSTPPRRRARRPWRTLIPGAAPALLLLASACLSACLRTGMDTAGESTVRIYEDTIPCADCPGILMNLRLSVEDSSYRRSLTYLEGEDGKDISFADSGRYTVRKGYQGDDQAILYLLKEEGSEREQAFLASGDSTLTMLDGNREVIRSGLNYTLRRKTGTP